MLYDKLDPFCSMHECVICQRKYFCHGYARLLFESGMNDVTSAHNFPRTHASTCLTCRWFFLTWTSCTCTSLISLLFSISPHPFSCSTSGFFWISRDRFGAKQPRSKSPFPASLWAVRMNYSLSIYSRTSSFASVYIAFRMSTTCPMWWQIHRSAPCCMRRIVCLCLRRSRSCLWRRFCCRTHAPGQLLTWMRR